MGAFLANQSDKGTQKVAAGVSFAARLAFEGICHAHEDGTETLNDITLTAEPGEMLCLLGPSGSGKTTLLRIAAGIESQTAGRILLNDREIAGPEVFLPPEKRSIGLVFQDFALFPHLTILENIKYGLTALSGKEAEKEARISLRRVGLENLSASYPHALSGGEQQRVALARALAPRPAVLLMDEPFSGLDSRLKDSVRAETLALLRQSRATSIIVTHDAEEAMRMGDRIALLRDGRLVQVGTATELYQKPANLFVARFFSELNVFRGTITGGAVETPLGRFSVPDLADRTEVYLAVRLHSVKIHETEGNIPGRITSRRYLGESEVLEIAVPGAEETVRARIAYGELPQGIKEIMLFVDESAVMVFETSVH